MVKKFLFTVGTGFGRLKELERRLRRLAIVIGAAVCDFSSICMFMVSMYSERRGLSDKTNLKAINWKIFRILLKEANFLLRTTEREWIQVL